MLPPSASPSSPGERRKLGRYVVLDRLGEGGMGTVYLAHDPELDRKVAIKLLRGGSSERSRLRMQREAQAMAQLSHDNVAKVYDVGRIDDEVFMAMEYLPGGSLDEWLAAEARGWREVLRLFIAAGRGLAAAHAVGLIHRDFKPANVLLGLDGVPKVTDFGLVRSLGGSTETGSQELSLPPLPEAEPASAPTAASGAIGRSSADLLSSFPSGLFNAKTLPSGELADSSRSALLMQLTQEGVSVGTPAYMSPEQFRGRHVDARSDQFSFCIALHEALWGVGPFEGDDIRSRLRSVLDNQRGPRPREREVPAWIFPLLDRGLQALPEARWPAMQELLEALADDPEQRRRTRRRRLVGLAAGLGLTLAFAGAQRQAAARCAPLAEAAAQQWTRAKPGLEAALREGGGAEVEARLAQLELGLDSWVSSWGRARSASCPRSLGAWVRAPAPTPTEACLDQQLDGLGARLDTLEAHAAAPSVAAEAITALGTLPEPSACEDPRYAQAVAGEGSSAACPSALRQAVHELRALELAGLERDGRARADTLLADPSLLACPPLHDQVLLTAARLDPRPLEPESPARARLALALRRANERDDLPMAGDAALALAKLELRARNDAASEVWLELAQLFNARLGSPLEQLIEIELLRASALVERGAHEAAALALGQLDARTRDGLADTHPARLRYLELALRFELARERDAPADALLREAAALAERLYGPLHPRALRLSGLLAARGQDLERSVELLAQARMSSDAANGPQSLASAEITRMLATVHLRRGDARSAAAGFVDALERFEAQPDPSSEPHAKALSHYGVSLRRLGQLELAEQHAQASFEMYEQVLGPTHPGLAAPMLNLANIRADLGHLTEAVDLQRRALELCERYTPNSDILAVLLDNMAMYELARGHERDALRAAERAVAIGRLVFAPDDPRAIAFETRLARAEQANGRHGQARARFERQLAACEGRSDAAGASECADNRGRYAALLLELGEAPLALRYASESVASLDAGAELILRLELRFILVRARAASGQRSQAEAELEQLLGELERAPLGWRALLAADIRAWREAEAGP